MVDPILDEVMHCHGKCQTMFQEMKGVHFVEGVPDMEQRTSETSGGG